MLCQKRFVNRFVVIFLRHYIFPGAWQKREVRSVQRVYFDSQRQVLTAFRGVAAKQSAFA